MKWRWPSWSLEIVEPVVTVNGEPVVVGTPRGPGEIDKLSPTWIAVEEYLKAEIERQRDRNESATADAVKTALMRGQIRALRGVLALPEKKRGLLVPHDE